MRTPARRLLGRRAGAERRGRGRSGSTPPSGTGDATAAVGEVTVWGARARVRTGTGTLFLVEVVGEWKIVAAGCQPRGTDLPYLCAVGGS